MAPQSVPPPDARPPAGSGRPTRDDWESKRERSELIVLLHAIGVTPVQAIVITDLFAERRTSLAELRRQEAGLESGDLLIRTMSKNAERILAETEASLSPEEAAQLERFRQQGVALVQMSDLGIIAYLEDVASHEHQPPVF